MPKYHDSRNGHIHGNHFHLLLPSLSPWFGVHYLIGGGGGGGGVIAVGVCYCWGLFVVVFSVFSGLPICELCKGQEIFPYNKSHQTLKLP